MNGAGENPFYLFHMPIEKEKNIGKYVAFSKDALRGNNVSNNKAIGILTKNKKIASLINDPTEKSHLLKKMQKEAKGGSLTEEGLRNVFGEIIGEKSGDIRMVSEQEAKGISREFFGNRRGYNIVKKSKEIASQDRVLALKQKMNDAKKNSLVVSPRGGSSPMAKTGSSSGRSAALHLKF